uniref:Uncharacterized protein n=1 Tax=Salix viminalis TaxID=40686 RepID=A0A6N2NFK8_SALVM
MAEKDQPLPKFGNGMSTTQHQLRIYRYTKVTIIDANKFDPFYCKYTIHFSLIMDLWINRKSNYTSDH